jgi:hypothetical protein
MKCEANFIGAAFGGPPAEDSTGQVQNPKFDNGGCSSAGRAPGCGPGGRGFKSHHSPHFKASIEPSSIEAVLGIGYSVWAA